MSDSPIGTPASAGDLAADAASRSAGEAPAATGDDAVDEALGRLRDVEALDLHAQLATFEAVHGALQDRLADAEG